MKLTFLLSLVFLAILASCGDLQKSKVVKKVVQGRQFNAGCELEIDNFKYILEKPIPDDISCLEKSMELFLRLVETDRPGYLSRTALEAYVKTSVADFKPENLNAIRTVFQVNHLVFGDDPDYIPESSIKLLIGFLKTFNNEIVQVYRDFKSEDETDSTQHNIKRERVYRTISLLSKELMNMYVPNRRTEIHLLNISDILTSFETDENREDMDLIRSLLIVKRLILGGQKDVLTHIEFSDLAYKLPNLIRFVFDMVQLPNLKDVQSGNDQTQRAQLELVAKNIDDFEKLLFFKSNQEEVLFSIDDLLEIVPHFTDSFPNLEAYRDSIVQLKMMIMTEEKFKCSPVAPPVVPVTKPPTPVPSYSKCHLPELLPGEDKVKNSQFYVLISHVKEILNKSIAHYRIYEKYKVVLDSPLTINLKVSEVLLVFPQMEKHVGDFVRIANNYRFFKGNWDAPFYDTVIRRNPDAFFLINVIEYVSTLAFRRYGTVTDGVGGYGVDVDQVEQVIWIFEDFLKDQEIVLEGRAANSAETATLMSALFQYQSNGDSYVNPNEVSEFAQSIFTALTAGEDFLVAMKSRDCKVDAWDRVEDLACFRKNFYSVLCEKYLNHFPRLFSSLGIKDCKKIPESDANMEFLKITEKAARTCTHFDRITQKEEVPMGKNDMMGIFAALMNIEGTVTRWDQNGNNVMDPQEVDDAYAVFGSAIRSMVAKEGDALVPLAKQIYFYLIRYEKTPDPKKFKNLLHFVGFLMRFNKKAPATRKTIASVLKIIGEQGTPDPFDCQSLRNPDLPVVRK